jgi:hypothetical protein
VCVLQQLTRRVARLPAPRSELYKNTLKQYAENKYVVDATGFKALPETINGRGAMIGARISPAAN